MRNLIAWSWSSVLVVAALASPVGAESPPSERTWSVTLEGCQLTQAESTAASGSAVIRLSLFSGEMTYSIAFANLGSAETEAHIHGPAQRGADGPILFTLPLGSPANGQMVLTNEQRLELESGRWYIDVHATDLPNGELRGQIDDGGSACPPPVDASVPAIDAPGNPGVDAGEGEGTGDGGCGGCASGGAGGPGAALLAAAVLVGARRRRR